MSSGPRIRRISETNADFNAAETMRFRRFRDFDDGETVTGLGYDIVIRRRHLGELHMPTGELVACDPFNGLETEPFDTALVPGAYSVVLFAAELRDEVVIAYAMLVVDESEPVQWEVASVVEQSSGRYDVDSGDGYPVDSSLGAFMDAATAKALMDYSHAVLPDDDDYRRTVRRRVRRRLEREYGWANVNLKHDADVPVPESQESLNVVAFDAGYGPGLYSTYLGWDDDEELARVVTDFDVLDLEFQKFPLSS